MIDQNSIVLRQLKNAKRINQDALLRNSINEHSDALVKLNQDQIRVGKAADGKDQAEYSSGSYADYKASLTTYLAPSPIADLYLTGSFVSSMFLQVKGSEYVFGSTDSKTADLQKVWRPMFGLTPISLQVGKLLVTNTFLQRFYVELNA